MPPVPPLPRIATAPPGPPASASLLRVPAAVADDGKGKGPGQGDDEGGAAGEGGSGAAHALDDDLFSRVPTLHANKRNGHHLVQRKSSKRRKNSHDREREAELKAISNFVPTRPAAEPWTAGRPMKRDTRKTRTGLGLAFGGRAAWDRDHTQSPPPPLSDVSLPIPESIHSSMSSDSEPIAYRVSALDILAPQPTLRFASNPRWAPPSGGSMPQRAESEKRKLSGREPYPEATLKAHKRIHDLADDLSTSDLRELMERDNRRRERKRQLDQEKVERQLARAAKDGTRNLARGRHGPRRRRPGHRPLVRRRDLVEEEAVRCLAKAAREAA